jgi:L-2,3-diaminopropanoate---citrate ligase
MAQPLTDSLAADWVAPLGGATCPAVDEVIRGRLLATFLREVGQMAPMTRGTDPDAYAQLERHGKPVFVELPATSGRMLAALARWSPSGHHEFVGPLTLRDGSGADRALTDPLHLADVLLAELVASEGGDPALERRRAALRSEMQDSITNTRVFAEAARDGTPWLNESGVRRFIGAEQSLVFGHPFHPAPKSGVLTNGVPGESYRPELGGRFQLHYFALAPELLSEYSLVDTSFIDSGARREAALNLPAALADWPLLPVHPWQANHIQERTDVQELMRKRRLIPLGPRGEHVFPTSSVRTVYAPEQDLFIKLPLDARITNFVRNNPVEHLERSLTASRIIQRIARSGGLDPLVLMPELAYRGLGSGACAAELRASSSVLFRRGVRDRNLPPPTVVAALLEPAVPGREAPIAEIIWSAARSAGRPLTSALVSDWAARYCEQALVPLLSLFAQHGVSLEAHVQNALVVLHEGWPTHLVVRDLEGTSLGRARGLRERTFLDLAPQDSGVWVEDDEASQRFAYYVIVNHFAHLFATLAAHGPAEEWQLWQVARGVLQDAPALQSDLGARYRDELLTRPELPVKANWVSSLRGSSERPSYVGMSNPLAAGAHT